MFINFFVMQDHVVRTNTFLYEASYQEDETSCWNKNIKIIKWKNLWLKQWPCHQSQVECFIKTQADWHFSSPELKSEVSFSDHNLPVVHLTVRLSENFFTFLHLRTPPFLREDHMRNFQKSSQEPFYRESWNSCGNILG